MHVWLNTCLCAYIRDAYHHFDNLNNSLSFHSKIGPDCKCFNFTIIKITNNLHTIKTYHRNQTDTDATNKNNTTYATILETTYVSVVYRNS